MVEVFKSKIMVLFMVVVIGVIFIDCTTSKKLEEKNERNIIVANS
jgi:hypothetical protein